MKRLARDTSRRTLGWEDSLARRRAAKKGGKGAPKSTCRASEDATGANDDDGDENGGRCQYRNEEK